MTAPAPSGGPSPLRIGGLALLGVGAVAGIIGIATLATGGVDGGSSAARGSWSSSRWMLSGIHFDHTWKNCPARAPSSPNRSANHVNPFHAGGKQP